MNSTATVAQPGGRFGLDLAPGRVAAVVEVRA